MTNSYTIIGLAIIAILLYYALWLVIIGTPIYLIVRYIEVNDFNKISNRYK